MTDVGQTGRGMPRGRTEVEPSGMDGLDMPYMQSYDVDEMHPSPPLHPGLYNLDEEDETRFSPGDPGVMEELHIGADEETLPPPPLTPTNRDYPRMPNGTYLHYHQSQDDEPPQATTEETEVRRPCLYMKASCITFFDSITFTYYTVESC